MCVHVIWLIPPALWPRVFPVVAITLLLVAAALLAGIPAKMIIWTFDEVSLTAMTAVGIQNSERSPNLRNQVRLAMK